MVNHNHWPRSNKGLDCPACPKEDMKKNKTTHAIFVLDRSGSMADCANATIDGYNEQLKAFRKGDVKVRVTCIQFDHNMGKNDITVLYENALPANVADLSHESYQPRGGTPMLDAVGEAIALADRDDKSDAILITIFSDGWENASSKHTYDSIAKLIQSRTERGNWTFAYIGANQDLSVVSRKMNIPIGNTMNYVATDWGTRDMYANSTNSRMMFAASAGLSSSNLFGEQHPDVDTGYEPKDINAKINRRARAKGAKV